MQKGNRKRDGGILPSQVPVFWSISIKLVYTPSFFPKFSGDESLIYCVVKLRAAQLPFAFHYSLGWCSTFLQSSASFLFIFIFCFSFYFPSFVCVCVSFSGVLVERKIFLFRYCTRFYIYTKKRQTLHRVTIFSSWSLLCLFFLFYLVGFLFFYIIIIIITTTRIFSSTSNSGKFPSSVKAITKERRKH